MVESKDIPSAHWAIISSFIVKFVNDKKVLSANGQSRKIQCLTKLKHINHFEFLRINLAHAVVMNESSGCAFMSFKKTKSASLHMH
jgi:hypothetical protein